MVDPSGHIPLLLITAGIGGVAGATGSIVGQLATTGEVNWNDVGIALGVGVVAGALLPFTATTYLGAAATGAAANLGQYTLSQMVNDRPFNRTDAVINTIIGAIAGVIAGPVARYSTLAPRYNPNARTMTELFRQPLKNDPNTLFSPLWKRNTFQQLVDKEINRATVAWLNWGRSLGSSIYSNLPWPDWLRKYFDTVYCRTREQRDPLSLPWPLGKFSDDNP